MTIKSFEVFVASDDKNGIVYKPINNIIVFDTPLKYMPKCIWACKNETTDDSYGVVFPGIASNETQEFQKKINGKVFGNKEDVDTNALMILTGDENGINSLLLVIINRKYIKYG